MLDDDKDPDAKDDSPKGDPDAPIKDDQHDDKSPPDSKNGNAGNDILDLVFKNSSDNLTNKSVGTNNSCNLPESATGSTANTLSDKATGDQDNTNTDKSFLESLKSLKDSFLATPIDFSLPELGDSSAPSIRVSGTLGSFSIQLDSNLGTIASVYHEYKESVFGKTVELGKTLYDAMVKGEGYKDIAELGFPVTEAGKGSAPDLVEKANLQEIEREIGIYDSKDAQDLFYRNDIEHQYDFLKSNTNSPDGSLNQFRQF